MITITLTFSKENIQQLLDRVGQCFGDDDGTSLKVESLESNPAALEAFKQELQSASDGFVAEIMDTSDESIANDWLYEWAPDPDTNTVPALDELGIKL